MAYFKTKDFIAKVRKHDLARSNRFEVVISSPSGYSEDRDEVSEKMLLAILQSLGDMHFISSFHNFFRAIEEAKRTGEGWESLVEKPIGKNMRMPKIIGQASHAFHGNEGFKEALSR